MNRVIIKTKGAIAPLILVAVLGSQGFAQAEINNQDKNRVENNSTQEVESNSSVEWYGGIGLNMTRVSEDPCEDITYGFIGKVGYDFNRYIGIEGRLIKTNWEYEGAKVEHAGIFIKPMLPVGENLHLYGLLGYGKTSTGNIKIFDDSGMAWGVGLNYSFADDETSEDNQTVEQENGLGVFVDYERLLQKSNVPDFDSLSIGLSYDF